MQEVTQMRTGAVSMEYKEGDVCKTREGGRVKIIIDDGGDQPLKGSDGYWRYRDGTVDTYDETPVDFIGYWR